MTIEQTPEPEEPRRPLEEVDEEATENGAPEDDPTTDAQPPSLEPEE